LFVRYNMAEDSEEKTGKRTFPPKVTIPAFARSKQIEEGVQPAIDLLHAENERLARENAQLKTDVTELKRDNQATKEIAGLEEKLARSVTNALEDANPRLASMVRTYFRRMVGGGAAVIAVAAIALTAAYFSIKYIMPNERFARVEQSTYEAQKQVGELRLELTDGLARLAEQNVALKKRTDAQKEDTDKQITGIQDKYGKLELKITNDIGEVYAFLVSEDGPYKVIAEHQENQKQYNSGLESKIDKVRTDSSASTTELELRLVRQKSYFDEEIMKAAGQTASCQQQNDTQYAEALSQIEAQKRQITELQTQNTTLTNQVKTYEVKVDSLQGTVDELKEMVLQHQKEAPKKKGLFW